MSSTPWARGLTATSAASTSSMSRPAVTRPQTLALTDLPHLNVRRLARDGFLDPGTEHQPGWRIGGEFLGDLIVTDGETRVDIVGSGSSSGIGASVGLDQTELKFGHRPSIRYIRPDLTVRSLPAGSPPNVGGDGVDQGGHALVRVALIYSDGRIDAQQLRTDAAEPRYL